MGAQWWFNVPKNQKLKLIKKYEELPIAIDVKTNDGLVGIVHAECPHADWNKLSTVLNGMDGTRMIYKCLWSTMSILQADVIKNVKAVVVGHMTQKNYNVRGNVHLIDTGSGYGWGHLTILDLDTMFPVGIFENK
jgi:serine/threonine protein phosphatase 1